MVKLHLKESEGLKKQLQEAYAKLRDKDEGQAEQLALKLAKIERQHAAALKSLFGKKSERRPKGNGKLGKRKPQTGHGPRPQPSLPIVEEIRTLSPAERICELCEQPMNEWEGKFDRSEEIEFKEPKLVLKKHLLQKYRCACGGCIKVASGPRKLFPRARYSINFALHVAVQKYCYHMPLTRQVKVFKRQGLEVSSATLWDYLSAMYGLLEPALTRLEEYILTKPVLGVDETKWPLLSNKKETESKLWWAWARRSEDAVHYTLDSSRSGEVAQRILGEYRGSIVVDGYQVYESLASKVPQLKLANCWAHARRELLPFEDEPRAARALRVIQRLYRLEKLARNKERTGAELLKWRQRKTRPLLNAFFRWLRTLMIPSTYDLHKALLYILKREKGLTLFLSNPSLPPDNNATERVIRGLVLGRKNHTGSRSERGTLVAALFYSLLDSAELAGIPPPEYLRIAIDAALNGDVIPLPHELVQARLAVAQS